MSKSNALLTLIMSYSALLAITVPRLLMVSMGILLEGHSSVVLCLIYYFVKFTPFGLATNVRLSVRKT